MDQEPEFIEAPKSAYLLYCDAKRPNIRRENPYLRNNEVNKIIASQWKRATSHEKLPFVTEAKRLKSIQKKYFGEIQKPFNAYLIWINEQRKELKNQEKEKAQSKTIVSELAAKWKTMTMDEKLPYLEQERIQKEEYKKAVDQIKTDLNLKYRAKPGRNQPRNSYMIFYKMKKEESGKVSKALVEEWRKIWKNMNDEEKKPFREEAEKGKAKTEISNPEDAIQEHDEESDSSLSNPLSPISEAHSESGNPSRSSSLEPLDYFSEIVVLDNDEQKSLENIEPTLKISDNFPWELALKSIL
ncbi:hypothetical protein CRE_21088 [Caenorhabditis remanei]|uniref:HMG box domain-containing protein n=1 Tax=Caenorhabditis remanei TaxID=31234 RepID=E3NTA4_CAERE|nr:hypothetical protein CRE_21088 [Caenorhabditis remanei]